MDMNEYLNTYGPGRVRDLAGKVGSSYAYLSQIAHGHRRPSTKFAQKLVKADKALTLPKLRPDVWGRQ